MFAIWWLDAPLRKEKIIPRRLLNKWIRKPGSKFYLRLALISPQTIIGPSLSAKVLTCLILMVAKKASVLN